jgi:OTU domain-containing protein 3
LSDQMYGDQKQHNDIRRRVVEYMRENADYYKSFISVHPGGGTRRNPKRKNAGAYSTPIAFTPPTSEEISRVFEDHLKSMAKGGTYGDNIEIMAFASAFDKDVKIYQRDFAYMITARNDDVSARDTLHIAYHVSDPPYFLSVTG